MFKHIQYATFYQRKGIGIYKDVCVCVCVHYIYFKPKINKSGDIHRKKRDKVKQTREVTLLQICFTLRF